MVTTKTTQKHASIFQGFNETLAGLLQFATIAGFHSELTFACLNLTIETLENAKNMFKVQYVHL